MIALRAHREGTLLPVRARPGARKNAITGQLDGMLKVSVTQAPEKGKANKALASVLSKGLGLRKSQIALITGETASKKQFLIRNITPNELARKIEQALSDC